MAILILTIAIDGDNLLLTAVPPPAKSHPGVGPKHQPTLDGPKHQDTSKPAWLLALEIVTGTMVGSLCIIALLTALQRCKSKSSIIIPWKKSASEKEHMQVYIGKIVTQQSAPFALYISETFSLVLMAVFFHWLQTLRCWRMYLDSAGKSLK